MIETIRKEQELWEALREKKDTLVIEGDLIKKVLRLRIAGKVAWAFGAGMIAVGVIIPSILLGGAYAPLPAIVGGAAIGIGAAAVGFALGANRLRRYKECERSDDRLILKTMWPCPPDFQS